VNKPGVKLLFCEISILALFTLFMCGRACASNPGLMLKCGALVGSIPLIVMIPTVILLHVLVRWVCKRLNWGGAASVVTHAAIFAMAISVVAIIAGSPPQMGRMLSIEARQPFADSKVNRFGWLVSVGSGSIFVAELEPAKSEMHDSQAKDWTKLPEADERRFLSRAHDDVLRFTGMRIDHENLMAVYYRSGTVRRNVFLIRYVDKDIVITASNEFRWLSMG
jgi:hypothetical protein